MLARASLHVARNHVFNAAPDCTWQDRCVMAGAGYAVRVAYWERRLRNARAAVRRQPPSSQARIRAMLP